MRGLRGALGFLTVVPSASMPDGRALAWFAPLGLALGLVLGGLGAVARGVWAPLLAAAIVTVADAALTGALHLDGIADAADGLLPHLDRDDRLRVMSQPDIGAFGVTALMAALTLRTAAIASLDERVWRLAALWAGSRWLMAVTVVSTANARPSGIARAFAVGASRPIVVATIAFPVAAATMGGVDVLVALLWGLAAGFGVVALARRRVGGYTGDVLGAAGITTETVGLIAAAAW